MYRRLIILSVIILAALAGLVWVGYGSLEIQQEGMAGRRLGEFAAVAEQIRQDVKRNLDEFMQREHNRPYTHYQNFYVPENASGDQEQMPLLPSPLGGRLENDLAYGNFQIEPDGNIITPNDGMLQRQQAASAEDALLREIELNKKNIVDNLWPALNSRMPGSFKADHYSDTRGRSGGQSSPNPRADADRLGKQVKGKAAQKQMGQNYPIQSLQSQDQEAQIIEQRRAVMMQNAASNSLALSPQAARSRGPTIQDEPQTQSSPMVQPPTTQASVTPQVPGAARGHAPPQQPQTPQAEVVQVRIEPFTPYVIPDPDPMMSIFGGQVFLLRQVQIENRQFLQGFRLNENKLIEDIRESANKFMRKGMTFELARPGEDSLAANVAFPAVLDFGFGDLRVNLMETDPLWIGREIRRLRYWYFSIISVVLLAVMLGLASLWRSARAQVRLAQKKDDFISAVSHELRTPLTSIRMYSEMLEKNWVKTPEKVTEYYRNMRQESERLSRLIENVLDFSRIQRGRKEYSFSAGDMNRCVADVVEMMRPYAAQKGFSIETELGRVDQSAFDSDAVTQIVVNLLDNAIKYSGDAEDKSIIVRTAGDNGFVLIEVEDHGPGVPSRQRKKIFEQFYRSGSEATRETNGTGLGLTLVKKFAEAHNGFVEIANARPTGAIFRVTLAAQA